MILHFQTNFEQHIFLGEICINQRSLDWFSCESLLSNASCKLPVKLQESSFSPSPISVGVELYQDTRITWSGAKNLTEHWVVVPSSVSISETLFLSECDGIWISWWSQDWTASRKKWAHAFLEIFCTFKYFHCIQRSSGNVMWSPGITGFFLFYFPEVIKNHTCASNTIWAPCLFEKWWMR